MIALLVMTDGRRECIERTVPSFLDALDRPDLVSELLIHDDSGDPEYSGFLVDRFGPLGFRVVSTPGRSGFGGAIRSAWWELREYSSARYVFHLEDDFVPTRTVPVADMARILGHHPHLVQIALRRQPWNPSEVAAGGVVEQHPGDYADVKWTDLQWLEHRRFFTTNPSLYRMELVEDEEWPEGDNSEGRFGIGLLEQDPARRFAFFGARNSGEWVEHIGAARVGTGY